MVMNPSPIGESIIDTIPPRAKFKRQALETSIVSIKSKHKRVLPGTHGLPIFRYKRIPYEYLIPKHITKYYRLNIRYRRNDPSNLGIYKVKDGDETLNRVVGYIEAKITELRRSKIPHIISPLNTREDFRSICNEAVAKIITYYGAFVNEAEFLKLCFQTINNRMQDHLRNMMCLKRWGFTEPIFESSSGNDEDIARTPVYAIYEEADLEPDSLSFREVFKCLDPDQRMMLEDYLESCQDISTNELFRMVEFEENPEILRIFDIIKANFTCFKTTLTVK